MKEVFFVEDESYCRHRRTQGSNSWQRIRCGGRCGAPKELSIRTCLYDLLLDDAICSRGHSALPFNDLWHDKMTAQFRLITIR